MRFLTNRISFFITLILICTFEFLFLSAHIIQADCNSLTAPTLDCSFGLVGDVITKFLGISAIVFFFMILIAGFRFITAGGNPENLNGARKSLLFTVVGFALVFLPFIVFQIIGKTSGVSSGLVVDNNGNISFNPLSTYTQTPVPSYLINSTTATPTPSPTAPGGGSGGINADWWSGVCDLNNYQAATKIASYPLDNQAFQGLLACGPRPSWDNGPNLTVQFFSGAYGVLEWQCVELVMRYMYIRYGVDPYPASGRLVVSNYHGTALVAYQNGYAKPVVGSIISDGTSGNGHTAIITQVNINARGDGNIVTMNENFAGTNNSPLVYYQIPVKNFYINDPYNGPVLGWLAPPGSG